MTREEAIAILQDEAYFLYEDDVPYNRQAFEMAIQALSQEPCEDIAQERYKDLCVYFGGAKDILKSREDFKAWLGRVKWHIHKAEELYEKYEYKKEPCEDAVSREAVKEIICAEFVDTQDGMSEWRNAVNDVVENILHKAEQLPSVTQKSGKWIGIDEEPHEDYECSCCGYVVSTFTANIEPHTEYKYCPNCGAKMESEVNE